MGECKNWVPDLRFEVSALLVGLFCAGLAGCRSSGETPNPAGTYVGAYGEAGVEIVYLFPDGRLEQTLVRGATIVYRNQGSWRLVKAPYHNFEIQNFIMAVRPSHGPPSPTDQGILCDTISTGWNASAWYAPTEVIEMTSEPETYLWKVSSRLPPPDPSVPRTRDWDYHRRVPAAEPRKGD